MDPNLSQTITTILGSAIAFAAIKFYDARRDRRSRARVEAKADEAVKQAKTAAEQGKAAADLSDETVKSSNDLSQQLRAITQRLIASEESREAEATRFNDLWDAYLKQSAYLEHQKLPERIRALERFSAELEAQQHKETSSDRR